MPLLGVVPLHPTGLPLPSLNTGRGGCSFSLSYLIVRCSGHRKVWYSHTRRANPTDFNPECTSESLSGLGVCGGRGMRICTASKTPGSPFPAYQALCFECGRSKPAGERKFRNPAPLFLESLLHAASASLPLRPSTERTNETRTGLT